MVWARNEEGSISDGGLYRVDGLRLNALDCYPGLAVGLRLEGGYPIANFGNKKALFTETGKAREKSLNYRESLGTTRNRVNITLRDKSPARGCEAKVGRGSVLEN
jgi:hypothetical protein